MGIFVKKEFFFQFDVGGICLLACVDVTCLSSGCVRHLSETAWLSVSSDM